MQFVGHVQKQDVCPFVFVRPGQIAKRWTVKPFDKSRIGRFAEQPGGTTSIPYLEKLIACCLIGHVRSMINLEGCGLTVLTLDLPDGREVGFRYQFRITDLKVIQRCGFWFHSDHRWWTPRSDISPVFGSIL